MCLRVTRSLSLGGPDRPRYFTRTPVKETGDHDSDDRGEKFGYNSLPRPTTTFLFTVQRTFLGFSRSHPFPLVFHSVSGPVQFGHRSPPEGEGSRKGWDTR